MNDGSHIVGIDPSLVGMAVTVLNQKGEIVHAQGWTDKKTLSAKHDDLIFYKMKGNTQLNRLKRILAVGFWTTLVLDRFKPCLVAIEGYAFSRAHTASSDLHELGGQLKTHMLKNGIPFRVYQPTTVKMAWTGSGNADKAQMQMSCYHDCGRDYTELTGAGDGLADSYLIAKLLWWEEQIRSGRHKLKQAPGTVQEVLQRKTKAEPIPLLERKLLCLEGKCE